MTKGRLERVIITRRAGLWDVTRQRATSGETGAGFRNLEEAFNYIRAIYEPDGELKPNALGAGQSDAAATIEACNMDSTTLVDADTKI